MLRKIIRLTILSLILCAIQVMADEDKKFSVFISQIVEHPALNRTRDGIIDALKAEGYENGQNLILKVESAQANPALAQQIASQYISMNPDIVVGIGTVSAQSFSKSALTGKVKLIFSSVTDPISAGLVDNLTKPGRNTSGVSNFVALEPQLSLFKQILPKLKKLGILYNPGEPNSIDIVEKLIKIAPDFDIILVPQIANKTSDVTQATIKLAEQVDAIFISNDSTALAALAAVIKVADKRKIPVFVSDTDAVEIGALAALGPNQYDVGLQTGYMIARVLQGKDINLQPVEFPSKSDLYINLSTAQKIDLVVPEDILKKAVKVIGMQ